MELTDCIPKNKFDLDAARNAAAVGFPGINPILPDLLKWLQDMNWPVAGLVMRLLSDAGPEISPHLCAILRSDDDVWKYWILSSQLTDKLCEEAWSLIEADVTRIAEQPTPGEILEEVHIEAKDTLAYRERRQP